jgi:hypothetical protein
MADKDLYIQQMDGSGNFTETNHTPVAGGYLGFDASKDVCGGNFGVFLKDIIPSVACGINLGTLAKPWDNIFAHHICIEPGGSIDFGSAAVNAADVCASNDLWAGGDIHSTGNICADMAVCASLKLVSLRAQIGSCGIQVSTTGDVTLASGDVSSASGHLIATLGNVCAPAGVLYGNNIVATLDSCAGRNVYGVDLIASDDVCAAGTIFGGGAMTAVGAITGAGICSTGHVNASCDIVALCNICSGASATIRGGYLCGNTSVDSGGSISSTSKIDAGTGFCACGQLGITCCVSPGALGYICFAGGMAFCAA